MRRRWYVLKKIRAGTVRLYETGLSSRSDVAQVDVEIGSVNQQLLNARLSLENSRIAYKHLTGHLPPSRLARPKIDHLVPRRRDEALDRALVENHAILAAEYNAASLEEATLTARAQYLPQVSLYGNAEVDGRRLNEIREDARWQVGVRLSVPILDFASVARYDQAKEQAYAAKFDAKDTKSAITRDVEGSWAGYNSYKANVAVLNKSTRAQETVLMGIRKQVEAGLLPVSDLLREEITAAGNDVQRIQNEINMLSSAYRIVVHFADLSIDELAAL